MTNKILELGSDSLDKFSRERQTTDDFSNNCNICKVNLNTGNKGVPCNTCKCKIHVKCTNLTNPTLQFKHFKGNWQCANCIRDTFPFVDIKNDLLQDLSFNSGEIKQPKKFNPKVKIEDKLKLMLSYSKHSPWYAYTHPNEKEHNFFTAELEEELTIKPHFDYYDIDGFKRSKSIWNKKTSLGMFHTNIGSLQANIILKISSMTMTFL